MGVSTDGRACEEVLQMIKNAIQRLVSDYPPGEFALSVDDAMAKACAESQAQGLREYTPYLVTIPGPTPYR